HRRHCPERLKLLCPFEQPFGLVEVQRRKPCGASKGMARAGVAVKKIDSVFRSTHKGIVDRLAHDHPAHWNWSCRDAFRGGEHRGNEPRAVLTESGAPP